MLSALWMFEQLMSCKTIEEIKWKKDKYYKRMIQEDIDYLELVPDHEQYPAARLELAENSVMYQRSSSQIVEAMNNANKRMRVRSGVDLVNATLLLLSMESERYDRQRTCAMNCGTMLTPKGNALRSSVLENLKEFDDDFGLAVKKEESQYNVCVRGKNTGVHDLDIVGEPDYYGVYEHSCTCGVVEKDGVPCVHVMALVKSKSLPFLTAMNVMPFYWTTKQWRVQFDYGVYEHSCTCGVVEKDGVPCVHVMALVKSKSLPFLTPTNVMPFYWTTKQWRVQFDETNNSVNSATITREYLTMKYEPDESLQYMPDFVVKRKRGRPKKTVRIKSALEKALAKKKKVKKKRPPSE
jgi:hypothetical protein